MSQNVEKTPDDYLDISANYILNKHLLKIIVAVEIAGFMMSGYSLAKGVLFRALLFFIIAFLAGLVAGRALQLEE